MFFYSASRRLAFLHMRVPAYARCRLMDVAAVEGLLVAAGVGEVGGVVGGEVVAAGEVFFGAHIYM